MPAFKHTIPEQAPRQRAKAPDLPTRVVKKLLPGQAGTMRLQEQFGDVLVCVRHRHDQNELYRWTTVELVVERKAIRGGRDPYLWVRIARYEHDLQGAVHRAGGRSSDKENLWRVRRSVVRGLGLTDRVVAAIRTNP